MRTMHDNRNESVNNDRWCPKHFCFSPWWKLRFWQLHFLWIDWEEKISMLFGVEKTSEKILSCSLLDVYSNISNLCACHVQIESVLFLQKEKDNILLFAQTWNNRKNHEHNWYFFFLCYSHVSMIKYERCIHVQLWMILVVMRNITRTDTLSLVSIDQNLRKWQRNFEFLRQVDWRNPQFFRIK